MNKAIIWIILLISCLAFCEVSFGQEDVFEPIPNEIIEMDSQHDSIATSACSACSVCASSADTFALPFKQLPFILISIVIVILLTVKKNRKQVLFWSLGLVLFVSLIVKVAQNSSVAIASTNLSLTKESLTQQDSLTIKVDEFDDAEFVSVTDDAEFETWDEFSETDEFASFEEGDEAPSEGLSEGENRNLLRTSLALLATLIAGLVFRLKNNKKVRYLLLLVSLIYLGFYSGGCPCMISSFQNLILLLLGESVRWLNLVWIVGLLLLTYFFGKIWCGWICHLGAFQEFIYRPDLSKHLLKPGIQKSFKVIRWIALIALLTQIVITRSNLFIKIDPFKVAFNLFSSHVSGYVLLAILLISSLFIYRPFCRSLCPVGLVLGWVTKIPGASTLSVNQDCKSCKRCEKACVSQAIENKKQTYSIINEECIRCGDCMQTCNFNAIK